MILSMFGTLAFVIPLTSFFNAVRSSGAATDQLMGGEVLLKISQIKETGFDIEQMIRRRGTTDDTRTLAATDEATSPTELVYQKKIKLIGMLDEINRISLRTLEDLRRACALSGSAEDASTRIIYDIIGRFYLGYSGYSGYSGGVMVLGGERLEPFCQGFSANFGQGDPRAVTQIDNEKIAVYSHEFIRPLESGLEGLVANKKKMEPILGLLGGTVLPLLYGWLGASIFIIRMIAFTPVGMLNLADVFIGIPLRLGLGAIAGLALGWFNITSEVTQLTTTPFALAFVAGFSTDILFSFLQRVTNAFSNAPVPEASARGMASASDTVGRIGG